MKLHRSRSARHGRVIDQHGNRLEETAPLPALGLPQRWRSTTGGVGARPDADLAWLAAVRSPQPPAAEVLPVLAAQSRPGRTLGLRVPQAPGPRPKAPVPDLLALSPDRERLALRAFERELAEAGAGQRDWIGLLRAELAQSASRLHTVRAATRTALREQQARLGRVSAQLRRAIGGPVRMVSPADQPRRMEQAYEEGGTEQLRKLTPSLLAELDARAKRGVAGVAS